MRGVDMKNLFPTQAAIGFSNFSIPKNYSVLVKKDNPDVLYRSIEIEMRGFEPAVLVSLAKFLTYATHELGVSVGKCWAPPKALHNRLTLLKSIHIYKKHRVQYEIRTYFRYFTLLKITGSTADTLLEYLQRNVPEGIALKVTKHSAKPDKILLNTSPLPFIV
uniref:Small ribosomal subunit protein uS10m n=1 Tax=Megafenestra aurita TaxID=2291010 RepID=A0A4Y7NHX8_9CRUS|nr:EOG090X0GP9 [Megafenestra aurita]SVE92732.1 EOG090X0GP9 [Megafenestra aurita]